MFSKLRVARQDALMPTRTNDSPATVTTEATVQKKLVAFNMSTPDLDGKVGIIAILTTEDIFTENGNFGVNATNNFSIFPDNPVRAELAKRDSFGINGTNNYSFFQNGSEKSKDVIASTSDKPEKLVSNPKIFSREPRSFVRHSPQPGDQEDASLSSFQL